MVPSIQRIFAITLVAASLSAPTWVLAEGDVSVALTANRVITKPGGAETLIPGDKAKPGEVIEYRAAYRNAGTRGVRYLDATLPIPAGVEYLPLTAAPAQVEASLDGRSFEPVPLKRRVRLADGSEALRDVPVSEYRFLRWRLGDLASHQQQTVRARVRVSASTTEVVALPVDRR